MSDLVCPRCGGTKGYNVPYGDSAGWHDCSACDGTGRAPAPPPSPPPPPPEGLSEWHLIRADAETVFNWFSNRNMTAPAALEAQAAARRVLCDIRDRERVETQAATATPVPGAPHPPTPKGQDVLGGAIHPSDPRMHEPMTNFAAKLAAESKPCPPEFAQVIEKEFWNMCDGKGPAHATAAPSGDSISDAAVEAACKAYESDVLSDTPDPPDANRYRMRFAISAALPHLGASAPASAAQPQGVDREALRHLIASLQYDGRISPIPESDDGVIADAVLALFKGGGKGEEK